MHDVLPLKVGATPVAKAGGVHSQRLPLRQQAGKGGERRVHSKKWGPWQQFGRHQIAPDEPQRRVTDGGNSSQAVHGATQQQDQQPPLARCWGCCWGRPLLGRYSRVACQ